MHKIFITNHFLGITGVDATTAITFYNVSDTTQQGFMNKMK